VIGIAKTGSGKTLAFVLPIVEKAVNEPMRVNQPFTLVLAPTRELADQIAEEFNVYGKEFGVFAMVVIGGESETLQRGKLERKGRCVLVATVGRLNDFLQRGVTDLSHVRYVVLDEADLMLDSGFIYPITKILSHVKKPEQVAMFSATWPDEIRRFAAQFTHDPVVLRIGKEEKLNPCEEIVHRVTITQTLGKARLPEILALVRLYVHRNDRVLVFTQKRRQVGMVEDYLKENGFRGKVVGMIGGNAQSWRRKALDAFKSGAVPILIATNVVGRGIDVPDVKVVINRFFPASIEEYVHKVGRTGRAGKEVRKGCFF